jgi:hypothetical protein
MVYSFRKRKLKRTWGNTTTNTTNTGIDFDDLEAAAKFSCRFLGQPAPDLRALAAQFKKQNEFNESDDGKVDNEEEEDHNNNNNQPNINHEPDDNTSTSTEKLSSSTSPINEPPLSEEEEVDRIEDLETDLEKTKLFFAKLKHFYKDKYDRVVLVFIDSLQVCMCILLFYFHMLISIIRMIIIYSYIHP